jgi:hypothetical protein
MEHSYPGQLSHQTCTKVRSSTSAKKATPTRLEVRLKDTKAQPRPFDLEVNSKKKMLINY